VLKQFLQQLLLLTTRKPRRTICVNKILILIELPSWRHVLQLLEIESSIKPHNIPKACDSIALRTETCVELYIMDHPYMIPFMDTGTLLKFGTLCGQLHVWTVAYVDNCICGQLHKQTLGTLQMALHGAACNLKNSHT